MGLISSYILEADRKMGNKNPQSFTDHLSEKISEDEETSLQMFDKKILQARKDNADLYNKYMCFKTIEYIKASETQECSIEGYLKMISHAKKVIHGADQLKDHQKFGVKLTQEINPEIQYPPNFFIFDFDRTINYSVSTKNEGY